MTLLQKHLTVLYPLRIILVVPLEVGTHRQAEILKSMVRSGPRASR